MRFTPKKVFVDYNTWLSMQNNKLNPIPTDFAVLLGGKFIKAGFSVEYEKRVGSYFFDLYIMEIPFLLQEIDGISHEDEKQRLKDVSKERYASYQGWTVIRWSNEQVLEQSDYIVTWIIGYASYRKQLKQKTFQLSNIFKDHLSIRQDFLQ